MSWFTRTFDGHIEGCRLYEDEDLLGVENCPCGDPHLSRDGEPLHEEDCTCYDLMVQQAVGAAEMLRDAIKEHGL